MAFIKKSLEEIDAAPQIGVLETGYSGDDINVIKGLATTWCCAFSPDESLFAWSCGFRNVVIVPWSRHRNAPCLFVHDEEQKRRGREEEVTINCGYEVVALSFGASVPELDMMTTVKKSWWKRLEHGGGLVLATGHPSGRIRIWDVYTARVLLELMDHRETVRHLSFAPDGSLRLVSASQDHLLKVWDLHDDGNMMKTLYGHRNMIMCCCWSPNGKILASVGRGKKVMLWDMDTFSLCQKLDGHFHDVMSCDFSPDGAVLATASLDTRVMLWDIYGGELVMVLYHVFPPPRPIYAAGANGAWVRCVTFSRDGCHVASICDDGKVRIWNLVEDMDPVAVAVNEEEMTCCSFSNSGRALAVGSRLGNVMFYQSPRYVAPLQHLARMVVRRHVGTKDLSNLIIPRPVMAYLQYKSW